MRTFLGVPMQIRGTVYGNLYLTDGDVGDAEFLGECFFCGEPSGVVARFDAGGDGVGDLLVGVL